NKEIHKRWMLFAIFVVVQEAAKLAAQLPPKSDFMVFCPRHKDVFRVNSAILQMTRTAAGIRNSTIFDFKKGETMLVVEAGKQAAALKIRNGSIVTVFQDTSTSGQSTDDIQVTYTAPDGSKNVGWLTLGEVDWPWCHTGHSSQGVECDTGIVVLTKSQVTTRRWLYTAVSRCRHKCYLVCVPETLDECLDPDNNPERRTLLPVFLDKAKQHFH
ncbi:MAG: ATP-binding domain-containing protein, partial [Verrucomicrobiota bacterium]